MTWWSWVLGVTAVAFIVVGFGMLGRASVQMFRHVHAAVPPNKSLKETVNDGLTPFESLYSSCNQEALLKDLDGIIERVLG